MRIGWCVAVATSVVLTLSFRASATDTKAHITGIYSDLEYNQEGGDLLGTEIFIVYSADDSFVGFVQCWEGGTTRPDVVPIKVSGDTISFKVLAPSLGEGTYKGRVVKTGFDGEWTHPSADGTSKTEPIHLKRKQSYWQ